MDKCLREHSHCLNEDGTLPTRLLDIGPTDGSCEPRIVYGARLTDQRARYLAMSYCWGNTTKQSQWTLRNENVENFERGIDVTQIPQSFRDIIKLTKALKERYIWIDALCILQDSPEDWEREAATMAHTYANALCTIISPASDPTQAMFVERDPSLTRPACLQLSSRKGGHSATVRLHPILPKWSIDPMFAIGSDGPGLRASQPTGKRAWCLQEYELSCRTVIFTSHQIGWACKEMQCSEEDFSVTSPLPATVSSSSKKVSLNLTVHADQSWLRWGWVVLGRVARLLSSLLSHFGSSKEIPIPTAEFHRKLIEPPGLYRKWEKLVEEYTSRQLTNPGDRLCAVAGLADKRRHETGDQYLMGLWRNNLKNELLWRVENPLKSSRINGLSGSPTWSWIAVNSPVCFPRRPYALDIFESRRASPIGDEISIVKIEPNGLYSLTTAISVRITMKGRLMWASIQQVECHTDEYDFRLGMKLVDAKSRALGRVFPDDQELFPNDSALYCLWMDAGIVEDADLDPEPERYTGGFGLALSRQVDTEEIYTRVGFIVFDGRMFKEIHQVKESQFTIV